MGKWDGKLTSWSILRLRSEDIPAARKISCRNNRFDPRRLVFGPDQMTVTRRGKEPTVLPCMSSVSRDSATPSQ